MVASVYTHPLGFYGHAPGPTIGMWDNQGPTPVRGDWPLHPNTAYAIEGNIKVQVAEWDNQWVQIKLDASISRSHPVIFSKLSRFVRSKHRRTASDPFT